MLEWCPGLLEPDGLPKFVDELVPFCFMIMLAFD